MKKNVKVVKEMPKGKIEKKVKLSDLPIGNYFRFPDYTLEEVISEKNEATLWLSIKIQPEKTGRVAIVSLDGKIVKEVDDNHLVIAHPVTINVADAEMIDE